MPRPCVCPRQRSQYALLRRCARLGFAEVLNVSRPSFVSFPIKESTVSSLCICFADRLSDWQRRKNVTEHDFAKR